MCRTLAVLVQAVTQYLSLSLSVSLSLRRYEMAVYTPFCRSHAHIDTTRREPWTLLGVPVPPPHDQYRRSLARPWHRLQSQRVMVDAALIFFLRCNCRQWMALDRDGMAAGTRHVAQ